MCVDDVQAQKAAKNAKMRRVGAINDRVTSERCSVPQFKCWFIVALHRRLIRGFLRNVAVMCGSALCVQDPTIGD